jgi:hypothetical protein
MTQALASRAFSVEFARPAYRVGRPAKARSNDRIEGQRTHGRTLTLRDLESGA